MADIDLRAAINAVSDVVQNRPRPLREFDQIYMKTADMVLQSEFVARWADGKRLAFIGDGDAISVCVSYLRHREILPYGPSEIVVFDFDQRICNAVERFADKERLSTLQSCLYNVLDAFPECGAFDSFYTNPPWGASNDGESVKVFMQRGMEATGYRGAGMVVVADDPDLDWTKRVLARLQSAALDAGFFVHRMPTHVHSYHLDDNPDLRSCNVIVNAVSDQGRSVPSEEIRDAGRLAHFYGRNLVARVRYVREQPRLDYGMAHDTEYEFDLLEEAN
jgi:N4-bis(aminopropyl)spermidine synthase